MIGWYLCADSLLAFKGAIVTCVGIYMIAFMNIIYKDGRPFWNNKSIISNGLCYFDFSSPSENSFLSFFFLNYMLIMGRYKYAGETNRSINAALIFGVIYLNVNCYFAGIANGVTYLYQSLMGTLTGFVYLVLCLTFDKEIHRWCEKTGFILQSSRLRKF